MQIQINTDNNIAGSARMTSYFTETLEASLSRFNEETSRMEEQLHAAKREAGLVPRRFATREELLGVLRRLGEELGRGLAQLGGGERLPARPGGPDAAGAGRRGVARQVARSDRRSPAAAVRAGEGRAVHRTGAPRPAPA